MLPRVGLISFKKKIKCVDNFSLWLVASFRRLEGVELNEQHAVDDPDKVADEVSTLVQMWVSLSLSLSFSFVWLH